MRVWGELIQAEKEREEFSKTLIALLTTEHLSSLGAEHLELDVLYQRLLLLPSFS